MRTLKMLCMIVITLFTLTSPTRGAILKVLEDYTTIQDAINAAKNGDRIMVSEGTYHENLEINGKNISLIAVGDVTIDGSTNGYYDRTIFIRNAICTIDGFTVKHNGSAIYARGMASYDDSEVDVTILNNSVTDYIKNGITVNGELATGRVRGNEVVTVPDPEVAQNGIQFGYGAKGLIQENSVSTDWYSGEDWTACGILIFESDKVTVQQNDISDAQTGIGIETWGWFCPSASDNIVIKNTIENSDWGITITAVSWDGYSTMDCYANNNRVTNNTVTVEEEGIGQIGIYIGAYDNSVTYTPEADNNKTIANIISGFDEDFVDEATTTKEHANNRPKPMNE